MFTFWFSKATKWITKEGTGKNKIKTVFGKAIVIDFTSEEFVRNRLWEEIKKVSNTL